MGGRREGIPTAGRAILPPCASCAGRARDHVESAWSLLIRCRPLATRLAADLAGDVEVEPMAELVDLITWARARGVVDEADVGLVVDLVASTPREPSAKPSGAYGAAQLAMAEQRGITVRQLRRRAG